MRRLRMSMALAVQGAAHRALLLTTSSGSEHTGGGDNEHGLSPSQQVAFMAISVGLVISAGLMSGLTLGLMSMDLVELEVLKRSGTTKEQKYAAAITPIVSNQHFLLVTLLLCNAVAMEALPLFLDRLADPVTAILISVTAVLVFGEVLPQAVCSRYGLAIGYYCAWLVRLLMAATSPISWPIGKLLDFLLGSEHRALFRRGQLKALVDIHGADEGLGGNLTEDEIKVICGALDLTSKTARKSMTPLNKVFMLPADARLNQQTMRAILASGHSRIPVYTRGDRSSIIGLILVKELLQYKTHQEVPVSDVRMRSLPRLPADTPMYDMLKLFQTGRSHMVVLTDTPATARAAAEAAAKAAAAAAAAAADAASDSSSNSSGGSPLASMLRGKSRKGRCRFESPLLQPIEDDLDAAEQQQEAQQQGSAAAPSLEQVGNGPEELRGSRGRVGFHALTDLLIPHDPRAPTAAGEGGAGVAVSDSSSSLIHLHASQFNNVQPSPEQFQQQQQPSDGALSIPVQRTSSGGGGSACSGHSSHKSAGLRTRSKSGPMLLALVGGKEGDGCADIIYGPEGVAVPIGIITIEDVIEELMQAEIVDETDLYVDNERSITVNAAALAQGLPDQLRLALASPQHQAAVAGVAGALAAGAVAAGGAGRVGGAAAGVNVRKLLRQRSSSTLSPGVGGSGSGSGGVFGAGGSGSWHGTYSADVAGSAGSVGVSPATAPTPKGLPSHLLSNNSSSGGGSSSTTASSTGVVVSAVSAGLAAVVGGGGGGAKKGQSTERLPLLSSSEQAAASLNR